MDHKKKSCSKKKYDSKDAADRAKKKRDSSRARIELGSDKARWEAEASEAGCSSKEFVTLLLDSYAAAKTSGRVPVATASANQPSASTSTAAPSRESTTALDVTIAYSDSKFSPCLSYDDDDHISPPAHDVSYRPTEDSFREYSSAQKGNEKSYHMENLEEETVENLVHPLQASAADDHVDWSSLPVMASPQECLQEQPCIAYLSCLQDLAPDVRCSHCRKTCSRETKHVGSAVIFIWVCKVHGVVKRWSSQPRLKTQGLNLGDFMLASNILVSGNNYAKVALMFRFMGMRIVSQTIFSQIQRLYCIPAIEEFWTEVQQRTLEEFRGIPIVVAGDGRNDSPGHSAQYLTYTMLEHDSTKILSVQIVDKRQVEGKSPNMERLGALKGLRELRGEGIHPAEFVTDAHTQIGALMKTEEFRDIVHQHDTWHGAKNLTKKLHAEADKKANSELKEWVQDIANHFWYCSSKANGSHQEFLGRWRGILHHVTGKHTWIDGVYTYPACEHEPMEHPTDGKSWLKAGSPAHLALGHVVTDKTFLRKIPYYTRFRHTGSLEVFHQHILMYASKRFAFSPPVYRARNLLAALDFTLHVDRALKLDNVGNVVHRRMYNKRSSRWFVITVKEPKSYEYIPSLLLKILEKRATVPGPLSQKARLSMDDPRRISSTLAGGEVPSVEELTQRQISRRPIH